MYYIYVLKSIKNHKNYVGYTGKNPLHRLKEHNAGSNKYTKGHRPYKLVYFEAYDSLDFTKKREKFLKSGNGRRVLKRLLENHRPRSSAG